MTVRVTWEFINFLIHSSIIQLRAVAQHQRSAERERAASLSSLVRMLVRRRARAPRAAWNEKDPPQADEVL